MFCFGRIQTKYIEEKGSLSLILILKNKSLFIAAHSERVNDQFHAGALFISVNVIQCNSLCGV